MTDNIVQHPHRDLMAEAKHERSIVDSAEAEKLQNAIFDAVIAYSDFLERNGLVWESGDLDDLPRLKASALIITHYYGWPPGTTDIKLKDGACDRVYGNGANPDPFGNGPSDIPHKQRREDD